MIENPTDKDLRTLRMIIYLFTNLITGQQYVGKSVNKFIDRYIGCKWWEKPSNKYIKNSVNKYGLENFKVSILEFDIETRTKLVEKEKYYIKTLNTLYPNGYNYLPGGEEIVHTEETKRLIAERQAKDFVFFNHKTQTMINVHNLAKFCRDNKLSATMMNNVASGKYKIHKGFTLPETEIKKWTVISPTGENHIILERELRPFCRKFNLHKFGITELCNGNISQYLGWTCPDFVFPDKKIYKIKSPNGQIFEIKEGYMADFCKEQNLSANSIFSIISKRTIHHKGWTLPETIIEYYNLLNPNGILFKIPKLDGLLSLFCKEQNLGYDAFYHIIYGDIKEHKGWKLA